MPNQPLRFEDIEAIRKQDPAKALPLFQELWEQQGQFRAAARFAQCLRKVGRFEEAITVCREALERYPNNKFVGNELAWALYDSKIKPAKEDSDLRATLAAAREIMSLEPDAMVKRRVALCVAKVAKENGRWNMVLEWTALLNPRDLSTDTPMYGDRKGMSERETYYINHSRALLEMRKFDDAQAVAKQGLGEFPNDLHLARTEALAFAGKGETDAAAALLRELILKHHAGWYVKVDLAGLELQRGDAASAYRLCCEAAQNSQDDEFKLSLFLTLIRAALATNQLEVAAEHIAFSKALREYHDWKIPSELTALEEETHKASESRNESYPSVPNDVNKLQSACRRRWKEGATAGLVRKAGRLGRIDPTKRHTFIFPDDYSGKVFVPLRNIPRTLAFEGRRVTFVLKPSFDKTRDVESFEAVDLLSHDEE